MNHNEIAIIISLITILALYFIIKRKRLKEYENAIENLIGINKYKRTILRKRYLELENISKYLSLDITKEDELLKNIKERYYKKVGNLKLKGKRLYIEKSIARVFKEKGKKEKSEQIDCLVDLIENKRIRFSLDYEYNSYAIGGKSGGGKTVFARKIIENTERRGYKTIYITAKADKKEREANSIYIFEKKEEVKNLIKEELDKEETKTHFIFDEIESYLGDKDFKELHELVGRLIREGRSKGILVGLINHSTTLNSFYGYGQKCHHLFLQTIVQTTADLIGKQLKRGLVEEGQKYTFYLTSEELFGSEIRRIQIWI